MQWLIDIVKEWIEAQGYALESWVQAQGYLTTGFVNRGDPAANDFTLTDFTRDTAFHDLDLSGIVPSNAKGVGFFVRTQSSIINKYIYFRKKGNVNETSISFVRTHVSNIIEDEDCFCPIGPDGKLQYRTSTDPWTQIIFTVKGWWL